MSTSITVGSARGITGQITYGSFEGVVTASDLLEAIVGELGAPEPPESKPAVQRHDGSLLLDRDPHAGSLQFQ